MAAWRQNEICHFVKGIKESKFVLHINCGRTLQWLIIQPPGHQILGCDSPTIVQAFVRRTSSWFCRWLTVTISDPGD